MFAIHPSPILSPEDPKYHDFADLYARSFPVFEQRSLAQQIMAFSDASHYRLDLYYLDQVFVGFLSYWQFENYTYIEHFAIHDKHRGRGFGASILNQFVPQQQRPVILEIDPIVDEVSAARLRFYERCGFMANDYPHTHPVYDEKYAPHPLIVLSSFQKLDDSLFQQFQNDLTNIVMRPKAFILETQRLVLRHLNDSDIDHLSSLLQDQTVMYAYEGALITDEVHQWLQRQINRYQNEGVGLYAAVLKENGAFIGQCGLTMQNYRGRQVMEVGYLLRPEYWHQGYATEAAIACKDYAFNILKVDELFSMIRHTNIASQKVALRNGMMQIDEYSKHYRGVDIPHLVFAVKPE